MLAVTAEGNLTQPRDGWWGLVLAEQAKSIGGRKNEEN